MAGVVEGNQGHTYGLSNWLPFTGSGCYFPDKYSARSFYLPGYGFSEKTENAECARIAPLYAGRLLPAHAPTASPSINGSPGNSTAPNPATAASRPSAAKTIKPPRKPSASTISTLLRPTTSPTSTSTAQPPSPAKTSCRPASRQNRRHARLRDHYLQKEVAAFVWSASLTGSLLVSGECQKTFT